MTAIRAPNAAYPRPVNALLNPHRDGLVGEFVFGGSAALTRRNLAQRGQEGVVGGAPAFAADYASFNSGLGSSLNTRVRTTMRELTMVAVMRSTGGQGAAVMSAGTPLCGFILRHPASRDWRFNNSASENPPGAAQVVIDNGEADFRCGIGWGREGDAPSLSIGSGGVGFGSSVGTVVGGGRASQDFVVAPVIGGLDPVAFDIAYLALYARILTARERLEVYQALRTGYAGRLAVL